MIDELQNTSTTVAPGWDPILGLIVADRSAGAAALIAADPGTGRSVLLRTAAQRARSAGYLAVSSAAGPLARYLTGADQQPGALRREDAAGPEAPTVSQWLSRTARKQPVLVTVDDVDRMDAGSAETLLGLTETLRAQPIVFLLTCRTAAAADLARPGLQHHHLPPLDMSGAAQLLRSRPTPLSGLATYEVIRQAKGNPRALVELCHAFSVGDVPEMLRIRSRYARRIEALPEAARRALLYLAGRTGREPLTTMLAAAGQSPVHPQVWEPAVAAGLVELRDDDVVFPDPLVAVAVYHAAPAAMRRRLHHDFAVALGHASFERAMHLAMLPLGGDVVTAAVLESESRTARREGRMRQAAVSAQRAAELSDDPGQAARRYVLATLATAAAGDSSWTRELCVRARRLTERPELCCSAATATAVALSRAGHQREAMDLLVRTARSHPSVDRATALGLAVGAAVVAGHSGLGAHCDTAATLLGAAAAQPLRPTSTPYLSEADPALQQAVVAVTLDPSCASRHRHLIGADRELERMPAYDKLATATLADALGESELAITLRWQVLQRPRAREETAAFPEAWPQLIHGLITTARWQDADHALDCADELAATQDLPVLRVHLTALRAMLLAFRGDASAARSLVENVWPDLDLGDNLSAHSWLLRACGYAAFVAGDFDAAFRNFLAMTAVDTRSRPTPQHGVDALALAMAAHRTNTPADVRHALESLRRARGPRPDIRTQLMLSQAEALLADDESAEDCYRFAISEPRAGTWPVMLALARLHYGAWLRRRRRHVDARVQLAEAAAAFGEIGADAFARVARIELRASGGDPVDELPAGDLPAGVALLSAQQQQIARLAAQGLRNREVAERLQLSPRTVSSHLHNVYLRLGITHRHQLRQLLPPE